MSSSVESLVVSSFIHNEGFVRRVLPHIQDEYFEDASNRIFIDEVRKYFTEYDALPTKEAMVIELETRRDLTADQFTSLVNMMRTSEEEPHELKWLVYTTEKNTSDSFRTHTCVFRN